MHFVDLVELATYCQEKFKEKLAEIGREYVKTQFFSRSGGSNIKGYDVIITSSTTHIFEQSGEGLLVHVSKMDGTTFLDFEYIKVDGSVIENELCHTRDSLGRAPSRRYTLSAKQIEGTQFVIEMSLDSVPLITFVGNWEDQVLKAYKLFHHLVFARTDIELHYIIEAYEQDERIQNLEQARIENECISRILQNEIDQYKGLLYDIKNLLNSKSYSRN